MISFDPFVVKKAVMLAPMEDITDIAYRQICRELGAEVVFTEFINADGLVRGCSRGKKKMEIADSERPVGIQIYGNDTDAMVSSAIMASQRNPDLLDVNAGCWVKKVSSRGAGAGLLKDPQFMQKMLKQVVNAVDVPVSVKTRIGWCENTINIVEIAKRLEDIGVRMLTIHCRTRSVGHSGPPQWHWIAKVKQAVSMPVIVNGGIVQPEDALEAFKQTSADGVMVARGAIGRPWIFKQIQELLSYGKIRTSFGLEEKVRLCEHHLKRTVALRGEKRGIPSFRKYYQGYLKGFENASKFRLQLMTATSFSQVQEMLQSFASGMFHTEQTMATKTECSLYKN